jgi:hypothetical protein
LFCIAVFFFLLAITGFTPAEDIQEVVVFPLMDTARIQNSRPKITVDLHTIEGSEDWALARLLVDGMDVSAMTEAGDQTLSYLPRADLVHGKHTITLEAMDGNGTILPPRSWGFSIPRSEMFDEATGRILLDAQTDYRLAAKKHSPEPVWKLQSNATLNSIASSKDLTVSLDANAWYGEQEKQEITGEAVNLNNYLLALDYRKQRLCIGDLNVVGTELISPSIARRGGLLELIYGTSAARAFLVRSNQVTGFDNIAGVDDPDQRLFGGSLEHRWENTGNLSVKATAISGKNQNPDDFQTGSTVPASDGQTYVLKISASPNAEKLSLDGEVGLSDFDADTTDDFESEKGSAWLTRFTSRIGSYDYGGGYKRLGLDFRSIADTTAVDNREEYTLFGTKSFKESTLTASGFNVTDNMKKDPLLPVVRNTTLDLAYNLFKADWPVIFVNTNVTFQNSSDEPDNIDAIENLTQTLTGGFALVRGKWNLAPTYTFTYFEDDSITDSDSQTHQAALMLGIQPMERLSLNPSLSWSQTDSGRLAPTTRTFQGTLAGTWLLNPEHDLFLTLSAMDLDTDDHSSHTATVDHILQYNWRPETPFFRQARKTVSLRGRYYRLDDRVGEDSEEDCSIFLAISIGGLPLELF